MSKYDFDLFVIGAGSGGVRAARMSAGFGAKTAIAEDRYLGGTCVNVGCVPKKLLVYASHYAEEFENSKGFGWEPGKPAFAWESLIRNKNREILRLNSAYEKLLLDAGVKLLNGRALIMDAHTVSVDNRSYTAERILVATGGWPVLPEIPGKEYGISSNEAFYLETLPEKIVIIGGGYIAVEFAGIFNGLGADTTLVYRGPLFLRGFDTEVRELLAREIEKKGVTLRTDTAIEGIIKTSAGLEVGLKGGSRLEADRVMFATGRKPNTVDLGLENIGVDLDDNGAMVVDNHYQTNVPSVYAIGDVTNRYTLTPVATAEGMAFSRRQYGGTLMPVDYDNIPTCIFSQPNLGTVGLTEEQARTLHKNISVYRSEFTAMKHTLSGDKERTFMKLLVNNDDDRVIGAHMIGADAGEIIQGIAIAMKAGATKAQFDSTIGIHPTTAEEFVTMRTSS